MYLKQVGLLPVYKENVKFRTDRIKEADIIVKTEMHEVDGEHYWEISKGF